MWKLIDVYHWAKDGWTITKYGGIGKKFGLWEGNTNKGYFNTADEAKNEYERLTNDLLHNV